MDWWCLLPMVMYTQNTVRVASEVTEGQGYHRMDSNVTAEGLMRLIFSAKHRFNLEARVHPSHCAAASGQARWKMLT